MLKSCILDGCQEHEFMSVLEAKIKPLFIYRVLSWDNYVNRSSNSKNNARLS